MIIEIISLASLILIIVMLRRIVDTFPHIILCATRWKENINLEENVSMKRSRDFIAAALIIPFCLIINKNHTFTFHFMKGMSEEASFGVVIGTFAAYYFFRLFTVNTFIPRKKNRDSNNAACNCDRTFFIILAIVLLVAEWIMSLTDMSREMTNNTMLWVSSAIYLLFIIRKFQIFQSSYSIFTSFLYLCALEIIPTGTLVVSAIIF